MERISFGAPSPGRLDELLAARAQWGRAHGVGPADLDASWEEDLAKSAVFDATTTVLQAAADPEFGADMVDHLEHGHARVGETLVGLLDTVTGSCPGRTFLQERGSR